MKKKIKKSPYASLSQNAIRSQSKPTSSVRAKRLEGGDLRVKGGCINGK